LAVKVADATPAAFVATVIVDVLLLKLPEAPDPGAVNVTFTPETGLLLASVTVAASGVAKAVLRPVDCGVVPAFAVIDMGDPGATINVVDPEMPEDVALIVVDPVFSADANPLALIVAAVGLEEAHVALAVKSCVALLLYVPIAVNCCPRPAATVGLAGVTAIDTNVGAEEVTDKVKASEVLCEAESVTCTVKVETAAEDGNPLNTPAPESAKPAGGVPFVTSHVNGGVPPTAANVCE
jgi:hypothetical protein